MREATARVDAFPVQHANWIDVPETEAPENPLEHSPRAWNAEDYARDQIQGLVRSVFLATTDRSVRQVVFAGFEPETGVRMLCRRVGEALAAETAGPIAVMGACPQLCDVGDMKKEPGSERGDGPSSVPPLRRIATRIRSNLWLVPCAPGNGDQTTTASLHSYLGELRREFEYSVIEAPPPGESGEAAAMAQFADGVVLVLSAQRTRRAAARKFMDALTCANAHVIGTVLADRTFPIPDKIYRRL